MTRVAAAYRAVVDNPTDAVQAACSGTRISTLLVYTSLVQGTFGTDHAFRPTTRRASHIVRKA